MKAKTIQEHFHSRAHHSHLRRIDRLIHLLGISRSQVEELLEREDRIPYDPVTPEQVEAFGKTLTEIGVIG